MGFPTDNRTFEMMRNEAIAYIERQRSKWTDENTSDPGMMILEALLYEIELQQYAYSQQSIAAQWQLLQSLSLQRQPLQRTTAMVTIGGRNGRVWRGQRFRLAQLDFEVGRTMDLVDNEIVAMYIADRFAWRRVRRSDIVIQPFRSSDTVYFCFAKPLQSGTTLDLFISFSTGGQGEWRYWDGENWERIEIESETEQLIRLSVAENWRPYALEGQEEEWLLAYVQAEPIRDETCVFPLLNAALLHQQFAYYRAYTLVCPRGEERLEPLYNHRQVNLCLVQWQREREWIDGEAVVHDDGTIHLQRSISQAEIVRLIVSEEQVLYEWAISGLPHQSFDVPFRALDVSQCLLQVRLEGANSWLDWNVTTFEEYPKQRETVFWREETQQFLLGDGYRAKVPAKGSKLRIIQAVASRGEDGHIKQHQQLVEEGGSAVALVRQDGRNGKNIETLEEAKERVLKLWQTTYVALNERQWLTVIQECMPQRYVDINVVLNHRWTGVTWCIEPQAVAIIVELPKEVALQPQRWLRALESSRPLNVTLQIVEARRIIVSLYCQLATTGERLQLEPLKQALNDELHLGMALDYRFIAQFLRQYAPHVVLQEMMLIPRYHLKRNSRGEWEIERHDSLYVDELTIEWEGGR